MILRVLPYTTGYLIDRLSSLHPERIITASTSPGLFNSNYFTSQHELDPAQILAAQINRFVSSHREIRPGHISSRALQLDKLGIAEPLIKPEIPSSPTRDVPAYVPLMKEPLPDERKVLLARIHEIMQARHTDQHYKNRFFRFFARYFDTKTLKNFVCAYDILNSIDHNVSFRFLKLFARNQPHIKPDDIALAINTLVKYKDKFQSFLATVRSLVEKNGKVIKGTLLELKVLNTLGALPFVKVHYVQKTVANVELDIIIEVEGRVYVVEVKTTLYPMGQQLKRQAAICYRYWWKRFVVIYKENNNMRTTQRKLANKKLPVIFFRELEDLNLKKFRKKVSWGKSRTI